MFLTLTPFLRRTRGLLIAGAFLLLLSVLFVLRSSGPRPEVVNGTVVPVGVVHRAAVPLIAFDAEVSFYRTLIDNNLFHPLGWAPPRPIEPYRLLGTILPRSANTLPRAILQSTTGQQIYVVSIGETLDASTKVVSIEANT